MPPKSKIFHPDSRVTLGVVLESIVDDNRPFVFPVRATELSIFRNPYIEADTFTVTFNATHLPLTPETIRAVSVELYLFNKESLGAQPESVTKGDDTDLFLYGPEIKPAIVGLGDTVDEDYDEDGRFITITGRDYTALFLDEDWNAGYRLRYKGRLDKAIQKLADDVPGSCGIMTVRVEIGQESVGQSVLIHRGYKDYLIGLPDAAERFLDDALPVVGRNEGRANRKGLTFPNKANYWEVMSTLAVRYGYIIFVKGTDIILTTPKTYIAGKSAVVAMAWGRNLHDIHISRKIGKERVPTIEVRSWDEAKQQTVKGQYPPDGEVRTNLAAVSVLNCKGEAKSVSLPSGKRKKGKNANALGGEKNEVQVYVVAGVTSQKQLNQIAESAHQQIGRAEQTVQFSTSDLVDLDDKPILDISSGDAVAVKFEPFNADIIRERLEPELVRRGYTEDEAAKLAAATDLMNAIREPVRVDEATIDFDQEDGITITIAARNYVNIVVAEEKA